MQKRKGGNSKAEKKKENKNKTEHLLGSFNIRVCQVEMGGGLQRKLRSLVFPAI